MLGNVMFMAHREVENRSRNRGFYQPVIHHHNLRPKLHKVRPWHLRLMHPNHS